jgi:hypothetical protein
MPSLVVDGALLLLSVALFGGFIWQHSALNNIFLHPKESQLF